MKEFNASKAISKKAKKYEKNIYQKYMFSYYQNIILKFFIIDRI